MTSLFFPKQLKGLRLWEKKEACFLASTIACSDMMARLLITLLEGEGYVARHVTDGKGMIDALRESVPDMLLLDVVLPDTTGFKLLEWVRSQPQLADVRAIMLTSKVGEEDVMQGLRAGADGYIFKPFTPESLLHASVMS